jgi:cytoskeletal protein RodZ
MIRAGQRLLEERKKKGLTLPEVSNATKIKEVFLSAIEKGDYHKLPSPSYAQGFVRSYARFLDLPEKEIMPLFRREFTGDKDYNILPRGFSKNKDIPIRKFKIRQAFLLGILVFIAVISYIFFQYRYSFISPPLNVEEPTEMAVIDASTVTVSGNTDSGSTVLVEDEAVSVDNEGKFKKELIVFPGKLTINVKSTNRFGKITTVERHVTIK